MHRPLLTVLALSLAAPPAAARPPLVDVPDRRASSRRGRGYRPEALVRALRSSQNRNQPARAAALPRLQQAQQALANPGTLTRAQLSTILGRTPYDIGRPYGSNYRADVPRRFVDYDGLFRTKKVENPQALPRWRAYVTKSLGEARTAAQLHERRSKIAQALTDHMDRRFVSGRKQWRATLAAADEGQLFDAARTMMLRINDLAHEKRIPQRQVGSGASYSSHEHQTLFTGSSVSSSSSLRLNQLVPHAATFVFNVAGGANLTRGSMIPHEARAVIEMGIQIQEIQRELQRRRSELTAPVARWVDGSRLSFKSVGKQSSVEIRVDRASVEALGLRGTGILSPRLEGMLASERSRAANQAISAPNPLLDATPAPPPPRR